MEKDFAGEMTRPNKNTLYVQKIVSSGGAASSK